ncbi:MAG: hypothetical protein DRI54_07575 [Bacteroidetes bacterium]|nr:MAG: hypothetical protein DRI54_07575 [Bacteroidota bacterium]
MTKELYQLAVENIEVMIKTNKDYKGVINQLDVLAYAENNFMDLEILQTMLMVMDERVRLKFLEPEAVESPSDFPNLIFRLGRIYERINQKMESIPTLN